MAGGTHLLCTAVGATIGPMAEVIVVSTCGTTKTALAFSSGLTDVATKATGLQGGSTDLAGCATKRAARGWQNGALESGCDGWLKMVRTSRCPQTQARHEMAHLAG